MVQRSNQKRKRLGWSVFLIAAVLAGVFFYVSNRPPTDEELIRNFDGHRASYERLRDMLEADQQLLRVADWGVQMTSKPGSFKPPNGGFPVDRYDQYMALLKDVGTTTAYREPGEYSDMGVVAWASGFAGETRHINICWLKHPPLTETSGTAQSFKGRPSYTHIEGDWYICRDR